MAGKTNNKTQLLLSVFQSDSKPVLSCSGARSEPTVTPSSAANVNKPLLNTSRTKSVVFKTRHMLAGSLRREMGTNATNQVTTIKSYKSYCHQNRKMINRDWKALCFHPAGIRSALHPVVVAPRTLSGNLVSSEEVTAGQWKRGGSSSSWLLVPN